MNHSQDQENLEDWRAWGMAIAGTSQAQKDAMDAAFDEAIPIPLPTRAVEVLEAIATSEARALLAHWASGDPAAPLTVEARKALARLRG